MAVNGGGEKLGVNKANVMVMTNHNVTTTLSCFRFKAHLESVHGTVLHEPGKTAVTGNPCPEPEPCKQDDIAELRSSFAFCTLLLLDTYDSYRQCDGDRIMNASSCCVTPPIM